MLRRRTPHPRASAIRPEGLPVKRKGLWTVIRKRAHIVFPLLAALVSALILTCPAYGAPFDWIANNAFARFAMFWCLAVCVVLSFANRLFRPSSVAIAATLVSIGIGCGFYFIYVLASPQPEDFSALLLSCLSGAVLGALAGTWLIYVLEVYIGHR